MTRYKIWMLLIGVTILAISFQNCGEKFVPLSPGIDSREDANATKCVNSPLAGIWTSNPTSPDDPSTETLTVSSDCTAVSKLCGGSVLFSNIPTYSGTAIQGSVTIQISGSNTNASCLPNGIYDCTFGLGPSSTGDVFSARCNNQFDLVYFRTAGTGPGGNPVLPPPPTPPPPPTS